MKVTTIMLSSFKYIIFGLKKLNVYGDWIQQPGAGNRINQTPTFPLSVFWTISFLKKIFYEKLFCIFPLITIKTDYCHLLMYSRKIVPVRLRN